MPAFPLTEQGLLAGLSAEVLARVRKLEVHGSIDSTNAALLARTDLPAGRTDVLLAEYQSAGRGRRGRAWLAPPGGAICLSVSWTFAQLPRDPGALGLAVGVCALRALRRFIPGRQRQAGPGTDPGVSADAAAPAGPMLKWPNDLVVGARKLGGILIDLRTGSGGSGYVVVGIGINAALGTALARQIAATGTAPVDLGELGIDAAGRTRVAAALIESIVAGLVQFERRGPAAFLDEWRGADALCGRAVRVLVAGAPVRGIARGIDADGALLVETAGGLQRFVSGEVTVRAEP